MTILNLTFSYSSLGHASKGVWSRKAHASVGFCVSCAGGKKPITMDSVPNPPIKKRFYKRWQFWAIVFGLGIVNMLINNDAPTDTSVNTPTPLPAITQTDNAASPKQYEIVNRWSIPNGGEGKVIVIPVSYLNQSDMAALGEQLKADTKNDRNAFIFIFTDKKAAESRDRVLNSTASELETALYDKHFVGNYSRNINSGFHKLEIWYDGVMGTNNKTIEY